MDTAPGTDGTHEARKAGPRRRWAEITAWLVLAGFVVAVLPSVAPQVFSPNKTTLTVGVVGPMSGPDAAAGRAMVEGARLLVDRVNASGALGERRVDLVVRDDGNDPAEARRQAEELVEDTDVVAVLGHFGAQPSSAAAVVYRDRGLAMVTGSGGVPQLTIGNDWVFRVGLNTELQAKFLANYMARVLGAKDLFVVHEADAFGRSLVLAMEDELSVLRRTGIGDLKVKKTWSVDTEASDVDAVYTGIADHLSKRYAGETIVLAVHEDTAVSLIRRIQDKPRRRFGTPVPYRIAGPAPLGDASLLEAFSKLRREKDQPGVYSEGIHAVAPFLSDVANQKAVEFRWRYENRYKRAPGAVAASFHDAAAVVVEALRLIDNDEADLATLRREVRDRIARRDSPEKAVKGVTGDIYFDRDGSAVKSVPIGVYHKRRLVSPPIQLSPVTSLATMNTRDAIQIHGRYFARTKIVHTGLEVNDVRDIDLSNRRFRLDFNVWFRFSGALELTGIDFLNAAEPVELGPPIVEETVDGVSYRLHNVTGVFEADFLDEGVTFGQRVLGLQFHHRDLNRERLIFVPDLLGMESGQGGSPAERVGRRIVFGDGQNWKVRRAEWYQDTEPIATRGNPRFGAQEVEGHSRFNVGIWIEPSALSLRGVLDRGLALHLFLLAGVAASLLAIAAIRGRESSHLLRAMWLPQVVVIAILLICGEEVVVNAMTERQATPYYIETAIIGFRILWWMVPAWLFNVATERFFWVPLERRTGREVPGVVRNFFAGLVYIVAGFGVTAFVFDQKITSLLATSGVLAMIIGLAIQMNLSNIFSGIAINVEKPFRMGDWIRVGDYEVGRVVHMTWRTTRIQTIDRNVICIPNSVASDSTLVNLSYPEEKYRSELVVHVDPGAKPPWVDKILVDAVLSAKGVLTDPPPEVRFMGVMEWSADYAIRYFCPDYPASIGLDAAVWRDVVRNLRIAGFVSVIHEEFTLFHLGEGAGADRDVAPILLDDVEVFEPFGQREKERVCRTLQRRRLEPGETVVCQGDEGDSLFIVAEGAFTVELAMEDDKTIEVGRLGVGDFFGEMALLTGEPRGATVTALTPSMVLEIGRAHINPILQEFPGIAEELSQILTRRTLENLRKQKAHRAANIEYASLAGKILANITRFFELPGAAPPEKT